MPAPKRRTTTKDIALVHQLYKGSQLRLSPEFQRDAVWPKAAKAYLIDTILSERPMPLFFFHRAISPQTGKHTRIGARVILYHAREVDAVAAFLRETLRIREADSSDKRLSLGLREFGYRSYHLVGSLPQRVTATPDLWSLRGQTFEIQIRSLLEHVWAEIEHDIVYKSGANWSTDLKRRFASIAAVLELLEQDFELLEESAAGLVTKVRDSLELRRHAHLDLDVPSMCALLEIERPDGLSFRSARESGKPFPPGISQLLMLALQRAGIRTTNTLRQALNSRSFRTVVARYAASEGIPHNEVSHLALLILQVASKAPAAFEIFFPEFAADMSIRAAIKSKSG